MKKSKGGNELYYELPNYKVNDAALMWYEYVVIMKTMKKGNCTEMKNKEGLGSRGRAK